jgi:cytochrome d ubiquinol oxidase subunit II
MCGRDRIGRVSTPAAGTGFLAGYVSSWLTPFALSLGLFTVVLFAFLAAVYLTIEADSESLKEDFRTRALVAGGLCFAAAVLTLLTALRDAPLMQEGLLGSTRAIPIHLLTGAFAVTALVALWKRRWHLARFALRHSSAASSGGGRRLSIPTCFLPTSHKRRRRTSDNPAAHLGCPGPGCGGLVPSLRYLFRIFKSK